MAKYKDLTGMKFGRLTVVTKSANKSKNRYVSWLCKCDCGNEKTVEARHLSDGNVRSCGCLQTEIGYSHQPLAAEAKRFEGTKIGHLGYKLPSNNSSGVKGVRFHKGANKWMARIVLKQKEIYLGLFDEFEDAVKARKDAEEKYFKPIIEEYNNGNTTNEVV